MSRRNRDNRETDVFIDLEKGEGTKSKSNDLHLQHEKHSTAHSHAHSPSHAYAHSHQQIKSSHVYIKDKTHGWVPGVLIDTDQEKGIATVISESVQRNEVKVKLNDYGKSQSLPLQCLDDHGARIVVNDMRDLPYSNEPSILYNLKERYEQQKTPYTRATGCVMVAINPYSWIEGLYAERLRREYANNIVWRGMELL